MSESIRSHDGTVPPILPEQAGIEQHRRLISDEIKARYDISEYSEIHTHRRIMTIPHSSEQAQQHQELLRHNIPVFPIVGVDEKNLLIDVPADARTLKQSLRFIARDIVGYGEIFHQVGVVLGRCQVSGMGLPERIDSRSVLSSLSFSLDPTDTFGGNVHLLPPYSLNTEISKSEEFVRLRHELLASSHITAEPMADELLRLVNEGWNSVRS